MLKIFVISQNTEILNESNFWLEMYVICILNFILSLTLFSLTSIKFSDIEWIQILLQSTNHFLFTSTKVLFVIIKIIKFKFLYRFPLKSILKIVKNYSIVEKNFHPI